MAGRVRIEVLARIEILGGGLLLFLLLIAPAGAVVADPALDEMRRVAELCSDQAEEMLRLAGRPLPDGLAGEQRKLALGYNAWLRKTAGELQALADRGREEIAARKRAAGMAPLVAAPGSGGSSSPAFVAEYQVLGQRIERDLREFGAPPAKKQDSQRP